MSKNSAYSLDAYSSTELEEGQISATHGLDKKRKIPIVPRVFLFIFSILVIILALAQIAGVVADPMYSEGYGKFLVTPILGVLIPLAAGIAGLVGTIIPKRSTIAAWAVYHWASLAFMVYIIALVTLMGYIISLSIISSCAVFQLAFCITYSIVCAQKW